MPKRSDLVAWSNPSIERTLAIGLRLLPAAAHVERQALSGAVGSKQGAGAIITLDVNHEVRYYARVTIKSFKCIDTETLFKLGRVARFVNLERSALRKLKQLDLARRIEDMRAPPANRLEALKGGRPGQWSVRVNDQFRICFRWNDGAEEVEIVDYH